jgi:hypothetical protein
MRNLPLVVFASLALFCSAPQPQPVVGAPIASASSPPVIAAPVHPLAAPTDPTAAKRRVEAAKLAYTAVSQGYVAGTATLDDVGAWSQRVYSAQKEVLTGQLLADAAQDRLEQMKKLEAVVGQRHAAGVAGAADAAKIAYWRVDAEIELARVAP